MKEKQKNLKNFKKEKKGISAMYNPSVIAKGSTAGITLIALVITIVLNCCEAAMERKLIKSNIILKI